MLPSWYHGRFYSLTFFSTFCSYLTHSKLNLSYFPKIFVQEVKVQGTNSWNLFVTTQDRQRRPEINYGPVRNDPRCGLNAASRSVAQRRIVGGSEAGFGTFPWQAYIRIGKNFIDNMEVSLFAGILFNCRHITLWWFISQRVVRHHRRSLCGSQCQSSQPSQNHFGRIRLEIQWWTLARSNLWSVRYQSASLLQVYPASRSIRCGCDSIKPQSGYGPSY